MKITFFLLVSVCIAASANSFGQKITLREKNASIEKILLEISHQTGHVFFYDAAILTHTKPVTINVREAAIEEVLKKIMKEEELDFSIEKKTVTIIKKQRTHEPPTVRQVADTFVIKGSITNAEDNTPIPGVSVLNRTSGLGTQTNKEGRFMLKVTLNDKLFVSHLNFENLTYEVRNNDDIFIKLAQKTITINTDVVVVGYATQKKTSLVSSVSTISGEELKFGGRNLSNNLQGQLPGLISFQRSGEPGYDNATFWIRGISTYNGAQNPLILVDGVPRSFNDIDPNEIATFSILKDAAATAVFGAEGANGVILVTTKRGRIQKTEISYRGEYSVLSPLRMPEFVGSAEYLSTYNEALRNEGKSPIWSDELIEKYKNHVDPDLYPDANWLKLLMRKHTSNTRHNLTFRGGTSKARFFVSGAYYKESGLFQNNALAQYSSNINLKRYNLRSNIDIDVSPTTLLRVDLSGQYIETNYPGVSSGSIFERASTIPPYLFPAVYSDGKLADHPRTSNNRVNPYNLLNNSGYTNEFRTNIQSRVDLEQKLNVITRGLSAKVSVSYDFAGFYSVATGKSINTYYATGRDADNKLIYTQIKSGTDQVTDGNTRQNATKNIYTEASLNYSRQFAQKHDVTAMALFYQKEAHSTGDRLPFRKMAYVGRATYAYDRRYSAEINVGITGSEAFAPGYRFGTFPAVGLAWMASNEHFYPEGLRNIVSNMKLRFSYGLTGNDYYGSQRFLYRGGFTGSDGGTLGYNSGGGLNRFSGLTEDRFSAPQLSWETEIKKNYGLELGFFGNRLNITVDYFDNYRYDILVQRRTVSGAAGFRQSPFQNFGKVSNKGIESNINFRQQIGKQSTLTFRGNFTFARNKILEIDEVKPLYPWMAVTGTRLNMPNVWVAERLFQNSDFDITTDAGGNPVYTLKKGIASQDYFNPNVRPGDIKYKDLTGDGKIDQFDQTRNVGHPYTPEIAFGFGAGYNYKGFSINLFFTGVANTSAILGEGDSRDKFFPFFFGMDESSVRTMARDRWQEGKGDNQQVLYPRLRTTRFANNYAPSTWWMRDASFIRLKNVEIGYNLPKKVTDRWKLSNARVYLLGYNLLTWDKIKYWDPEQGNGNAGLSYPQSRTYTVGAEVTF